MDRYVLSALVQNHAGVLSRVSGLLFRRGFNIESLTVGETVDRSISRMTIVVRSDPQTFDHIHKQLEKLEDVLAIEQIDQGAGVYRELALVKVVARSDRRADVVNIANAFRARVVDVAFDSLSIEVTGDTGKVDGLIEVLKPYGVIELARTGLSALERGSRALRADQPVVYEVMEEETEKVGA
jgi:acetolactate synthase-1/3 small subunit